jgi:pilus assembly protein CpaC
MNMMTLKMKSHMTMFIAAAAVLFIGLLLLLYPGTGAAQILPQQKVPEKLSITAGKSVIVQSDKSVSRISIAAPEIADAVVLSKRQVYLTGKAPGVTNLSLWERGKLSAVYDVEVTPDVSRLKEVLHTLFPDEKVKVIGAHDSITLSGTVSGVGTLDQMLSVAEPFAPEKVVNLLSVGGVQQVMLEVRVAEIRRSVMRRMGVNFNYISESGRNLGISLLNQLTSLPKDGWPSNPLEVTENVNYIFNFFNNGDSWTVFLDALKENGLAEVLAEPTLIALSGQTAEFLAGGEFPILVPNALGTVGIEYKPFGVGLSFTPIVMDNGKIHMNVAPEVSELDFSTAVQTEGFVVPGITTRRVATSIELADGQSFAVAGLLQDNIREIVSKFPVLGDVPVLGV